MDDKLNCWDFFKCGREIFRKERSDSVCIVSVISSMNGINSGINAGRNCWNVEGSYCMSSKANLGQEKDRGTITHKERFCKKCDFRMRVEKEEGDLFRD